MPSCPDSDCKYLLCDVRDAVFGKGPDGKDGVYGALSKKFSKWEGRIFLGVIAMGFLTLIGFTIAHEGKIARNEVMINAMIETVQIVKGTLEENQEKMIKMLHKMSENDEGK